MRAWRIFWCKEDGAVTVDWVVITAAIIAMCLSFIFMLTEAATNESTSVGAQLGSLGTE